MASRSILPIVLGVLVSFGAGTPSQSPNLSRNHLVDAAAAYIRSYQREFALLIADEQTVQQAFGVKDSQRIPLATRTTQGEIFITFLEGRRQWTAVRDVAQVDGVPVLDRVDIPTLLSREDADAVARRLFALNARYNIGGVIRNFNDPMIALLPLSDVHRSRFSFDVEKTERQSPGTVLATLSFRERERPTLVRPETNGAAYARGRLTLEAATGVIRRTEFTVRYDRIEATLVTEFTHEDRLNLWVPSMFSERYTMKADGLEDEATAISTYSNYRRFESRGRIIDTRPQ